MALKRSALACAVLAILALAMLGGDCGGGTKVQTCTKDGDCAAGQACHPVGRLCVQTCKDSTECPSTQGNCAALAGTGGTADGGVDGGAGPTKVCKCESDAKCGTGVVCNAGVDDTCETKCSTNEGCTEFGANRKCDTATGKCVLKDCVDDATLCTSGLQCNTTTRKCEPVGCTPPCSATQWCDTSGAAPTCKDKCTVGTCSVSQQVCEYATGKCIAAPACTSANAEPDVCVNGEYCSSANYCSDVPPATCTNFGSPHGRNWTPSNAAPVIYYVTKVSFGTDAAFCGGSSPVRAKIHVYAYSLSGGIGSTGAAVEGQLHYVRSNGSEGPTANTTQNVTTTNGGKNTEFDMNFCAPSGTTSLTIGLHFMVSSVTGNEYCFVVQ